MPAIELSARVVGPSFADAAAGIVAVGRRFDARGWAPAGAGNYSVRLDDGSVAVTVSGRHKGRLTPGDVMRVDLAGAALDAGQPSAETALHLDLYRRLPQVGAVLHGHSAPAVALTRARADARHWTVAGHELLKAFPGIATHDTARSLPIVANSQNMADILVELDGRLAASPAYLIRDHGLYGWGRDLDEAERVVEAVEWLIAAELAEATFRAGLDR